MNSQLEPRKLGRPIKYGPETIAIVNAGFDEGKSLAEIAEAQEGWTKDGLRDALERLGFKPRGCRLFPIQKPS